LKDSNLFSLKIHYFFSNSLKCSTAVCFKPIFVTVATVTKVLIGIQAEINQIKKIKIQIFLKESEKR